MNVDLKVVGGLVPISAYISTRIESVELIEVDGGVQVVDTKPVLEVSTTASALPPVSSDVIAVPLYT